MKDTEVVEFKNNDLCNCALSECKQTRIACHDWERKYSIWENESWKIAL